jgi:hypothetical protein
MQQLLDQQKKGLASLLAVLGAILYALELNFKWAPLTGDVSGENAFILTRPGL